jgi:ornithine cyclodeaminase
LRLITDQDVARVLNMKEAIASMKAAFTQFGQGAGAVLARGRATAEHAVGDVKNSVTISAMGAALPASGVVGTKVYSTVNGQFSFVIVLFDAKTGAPMATIESNELTRLRTAAATAVAVGKLVRADAKTLAVFGAGTQAQAHVEALMLVHQFAIVQICARSGASEFATKVAKKYSIKSIAVDAATAATADVIATCTRANEALFDGNAVKPGTLVVAVGSSKPVARELDDALLKRAALIAVEWLPAAKAEAGEFVRAAEGVIDVAKVVELGKLLAGTHAYTRGANDIIVYKSVGIGLEDVVLAKLVYDRT